MSRVKSTRDQQNILTQVCSCLIALLTNFSPLYCQTLDLESCTNPKTDPAEVCPMSTPYWSLILKHSACCCSRKHREFAIYVFYLLLISWGFISKLVLASGWWLTRHFLFNSLDGLSGNLVSAPHTGFCSSPLGQTDILLKLLSATRSLHRVIVVPKYLSHEWLDGVHTHITADWAHCLLASTLSN